MAVAVVLECWGVTHDLSYPAPDEPVFVARAVRMAATGDLDPRWFGHPGSTVIYPLAAFFHVEDVIAHGGPLFASNSAVGQRFLASPGHFYLIGRWWAIMFAVGAIPLLFALGRKLFGTGTALVAATWWTVLPLIVSYGRVVRTDSAGVFFTLLSVLLILRVFEHPTLGNEALAGAAIGFGVSSRYFLVTLLALLVATSVVARRREEGQSPVWGIVVGLGSALGCFILTTPYVVLDSAAAVRSITAENVRSIGHDGLSPLGNLRWYVTTAIPGAITWPLLILAVVGAVVVIRRRDTRQILLVGFVALFLVSISFGRLHWNRWAIPVMPILLLLAAHALVVLVAAITRRHSAQFASAVLITATFAFAATSTAAVIRLDEIASTHGTRVVALRWVQQHIPRSALIAEEVNTVPLFHSGYRYLYRHALAEGRTVEQYRRSGYQYLFTNPSIRDAYQKKADQYPKEVAFYRDLSRRSCLIATFHPHGTTGGPSIAIFQIEHPANHCPDGEHAPLGHA